MAVPALRIPLGLDTQSFEKSVNDAKSLTSTATNFIVKEFAKSQLKLVVNSDQFRPAIQSATQFAGQQFEKVKPQIQAFTQTAVRETAEAGLKVASVFASPAIKGSFQAFTAVGVPAVQGLASSLGPLAAGALAVYASFEVLTGIIRSAREQIAEMVAVADKAANLNLSPQFLQLFEGEARKLKVTTDELDAALTNAFIATKDKSPVDIGKFEVAKERITDIELALRVYNDQLAKTAGTQLQGLVAFRDAGNQEQKIRAVLQAMVELERIGQRAAALDVGEKFFGTAFVDRIRQGKTSADELLATMDKLKSSQDGIFPDALVLRAKAVDEQLGLAEGRLSRALKPAFDDVANVVLSIKSTFADFVDLIGRAAEKLNQLTGTNLSGLKDELKSVQEALASGTARLGLPQTASGRARLEQQEYDLRGKIANLEGATQGPDLPKVSRGAGAAPTLKKTGNEIRDPFDVAVDNIEKHIATINADTAATFKNSAAQAELRAEFQELTALKRADSGVTQKQIDAYEEYRKTLSATEALQAAGIKLTAEQESKFLSSTHGIRVATQAYNAAQEELQRLNSASSQVGSALSTAFADAVVEGKSLNDVFSSLVKTLEKAAINNIFGSIFNAPQSGGLSPFASLLSNIIPKFADGTSYAPGGLSIVGERGPELVNLSRGAQVIPNSIARSLGGDSSSFTFAPQIDARGASVEAVARLEGIVARQSAEFENRVVKTVRQARTARAL